MMTTNASIRFAVLLAGLAFACNGSEPDEDRGPIGKADLYGTCQGACGGQSDGNCYCDDICSYFGDCCSDRESECSAVSCADVGGACLSSPIDVTFAADCEDDYDRTSSDAACPAVNQSCCLPSAPQLSCSDVGGACLSSPIDVTFAADCEDDYNLASSDASCLAVNQACCI